MRIIFSSFMLVVLFTACRPAEKPATPSPEAKIRQRITGTWLVKIVATNASTIGTTTLNPDGGLVTKLTVNRTNIIENITYEGFWQIQDGSLLTTVTNTDNPKAQNSLGRTNHLKILDLNQREMVLETKTGKNYFRRQ